MSDAARPTRILVADDYEPFRRELIDTLRGHPELHIVAEAATGAEAVQLANTLRPDRLDLVLMDIEMPDMDGLAATAMIGAVDPDLPVVMLTVSRLDADLFEALRAGAVGFLSKNVVPSVLLRTLRDYQTHGALPMSRQMAAKMLAYFREQGSTARTSKMPDTAARLSDRETQVLAMIATGAHDREIAAALLVAETTVKTHVQNVLRKLHARNRAEAAALFRPADHW